MAKELVLFDEVSAVDWPRIARETEASDGNELYRATWMDRPVKVIDWSKAYREDLASGNWLDGPSGYVLPPASPISARCIIHALILALLIWAGVAVFLCWNVS